MIQVREHFDTVDDLMEHYKQIMKRTKEREDTALIKSINLQELKIKEEERRLQEEAKREEEEKVRLAQLDREKSIQAKKDEHIEKLRSIVASDGRDRATWCNSLLELVEIDNHIPKGSLKSETRVHPIPQIRQEAMLRIHEKFKDRPIPASTPWIAKFFNRDHTTVIHGLRKALAARTQNENH